MKILLGLFTLLMLTVALMGQQVEFKNPKMIEVGKISQGEKIQGTIEFTNTGSTPVEIAEVKASCGCTAVKPEKMVFASGESTSIPYTIDTERFSGVIQKSISIIFKDMEPAAHTFFVRAEVVTSMTISPRYINFKNVTQNADTTLTEFFEITNETDTPLAITKVYTDNQHVSAFPASVSIPAGKSHLFRIELKPIEVGRHNAKIMIQVDNQKDQEKALPIFVNVTAQLVEGSK
ncbi:MAG: DUF1573 domain-containing protein [Calditrichaeota bacterium]|nr:DUF1573 domain-containing protein [Calditrichota bacterium]